VLRVAIAYRAVEMAQSIASPTSVDGLRTILATEFTVRLGCFLPLSPMLRVPMGYILETA
jgi:hypothetical protein